MIPLIYRLAKAGDFVIVNEGGGSHVVLTDPVQRKRLPPVWRDENPPVCKSAQDLESLLADSIEAYRKLVRTPEGFRHQWTRHHIDRSIGRGDPEPNVPGLHEKREIRYVYVRAKPKEGPLLQMKRIARAVRARTRASVSCPEGGGFGGTGWQIRIPNGDVFNCYTVTGYSWQPDTNGLIGHNIDKWVDLLRELGRESSCATAVIAGGREFVCDDGRRFPLDECESRRVTDDDG